MGREATAELVSQHAVRRCGKRGCGKRGCGKGDARGAHAASGETFLAIADIDNNGGVNVIASSLCETAVWLRSAADQWVQLAAVPAMQTTSVADMNDDGLLDLVGWDRSGARVAWNRSGADYGWHVIQPLANTAPGDKRINAFGVGGRIEMRAGNLVQAASIQSPRVHFGLGRRPTADVARIVWPNGSVQAEFDLPSKATLAANQRLKGSCPWVFAFDGERFQFVKDFLWRSPLGLRINAQTTAGVMQTEDWIKIPGDSLAASKGRYQLRITAELWETHFFDHVRLLAIDHPADVELLIDERFIPNEAPSHRIRLATPRRPLHVVVDHRGRQLDATLRANDGRYADGFALGEYQGVAEEHWVAFDIPSSVAVDSEVLIVGHGWVYPTDSSLNVALAQGNTPKPFGLVLEQLDASGAWRTLDANLGFPAGKNKDVLISLPAGAVGDSRRFRLRTNMEVYWDSLLWSYEASHAEAAITTLATETAELRQRGYSRLLAVDRRRPDTPLYELESAEQRWLDLEGYYTRFGDVRELLTKVDDRYVIMNAGDEFVLEFNAGDEVRSGWRRDFVLVGDGWVKDGDFNTAFSRSIRPLPAHGDAGIRRAARSAVARSGLSEASRGLAALSHAVRHASTFSTRALASRGLPFHRSSTMTMKSRRILVTFAFLGLLVGPAIYLRTPSERSHGQIAGAQDGKELLARYGFLLQESARTRRDRLRASSSKDRLAAGPHRAANCRDGGQRRRGRFRP